MTQNAFAASAMIPIGQASTAGNLTFKSTATIVAKEGISMGAGAGAQKITTDVTGNDTAGMVAGMVASGVTAKGLNGIEAEANKLAKAPKGIDGVTEEAGNLAEDVGKAGKGLEGAAKGAESAAEDAGKVVETSYGKSSECLECKSKSNILQTGARQIDYNAYIKRLETIDMEYEGIRMDTTDISKIAQNTGMPEWKISKIKEHVFYNEHMLDSGVKRFDTDPEIADAWYRLTNGDFNQNDISLLNHEYFESKFESFYKTDYRTAHNKTEESGRIWDPYKEEN